MASKLAQYYAKARQQREAARIAWDAEFSQPVPESPRERDLRQLGQALKQTVEDVALYPLLLDAALTALREAGVAISVYKVSP